VYFAKYSESVIVQERIKVVFKEERWISMLKFNYKIWLTENVDLKVKEYMELLNVKHSWDDIVIEYTSADHEDYMKLFTSHECKHPKELYSPGKTVISHFTPISKDLVEKYHQGKMSKEEWDKLCRDTRQVSRGITDAIILTFQNFGREVALLSEREGWSNVCGAELAGIGKFEKKDDIFYSETQVGCLGSVITEVVID